jgi:hypothetical protein
MEEVSVLEKVVRNSLKYGLLYPIAFVKDLCILPFDLLIFPAKLRDCSPKWLKQRFEFVACRRYALYNYSLPECKPAEKYYFGKIFRDLVCKHYNCVDGNCSKVKPESSYAKGAEKFDSHIVE